MADLHDHVCLSAVSPTRLNDSSSGGDGGGDVDFASLLSTSCTRRSLQLGRDLSPSELAELEAQLEADIARQLLEDEAREARGEVDSDAEHLSDLSVNDSGMAAESTDEAATSGSEDSPLSAQPSSSADDEADVECDKENRTPSPARQSKRKSFLERAAELGQSASKRVSLTPASRSVTDRLMLSPNSAALRSCMRQAAAQGVIFSPSQLGQRFLSGGGADIGSPMPLQPFSPIAISKDAARRVSLPPSVDQQSPLADDEMGDETPVQVMSDDQSEEEHVSVAELRARLAAQEAQIVQAGELGQQLITEMEEMEERLTSQLAESERALHSRQSELERANKRASALESRLADAQHAVAHSNEQEQSARTELLRTQTRLTIFQASLNKAQSELAAAQAAANTAATKAAEEERSRCAEKLRLAESKLAEQAAELETLREELSVASLDAAANLKRALAAESAQRDESKLVSALKAGAELERRRASEREAALEAEVARLSSALEESVGEVERVQFALREERERAESLQLQLAKAVATHLRSPSGSILLLSPRSQIKRYQRQRNSQQFETLGEQLQMDEELRTAEEEEHSGEVAPVPLAEPLNAPSLRIDPETESLGDISPPLSLHAVEPIPPFIREEDENAPSRSRSRAGSLAPLQPLEDLPGAEAQHTKPEGHESAVFTISAFIRDAESTNPPATPASNANAAKQQTQAQKAPSSTKRLTSWLSSKLAEAEQSLRPMLATLTYSEEVEWRKQQAAQAAQTAVAARSKQLPQSARRTLAPSSRQQHAASTPAPASTARPQRSSSTPSSLQTVPATPSSAAAAYSAIAATPITRSLSDAELARVAAAASDGSSRSKAESTSDRADVLREYFHLCTLAVKLTCGLESVHATNACAQQLYEEALQRQVPFARWHQWIAQQLHERVRSATGAGGVGATPRGNSAVLDTTPRSRKPPTLPMATPGSKEAARAAAAAGTGLLPMPMPSVGSVPVTPASAVAPAGTARPRATPVPIRSFDTPSAAASKPQSQLEEDSGPDENHAPPPSSSPVASTPSAVKTLSFTSAATPRVVGPASTPAPVRAMVQTPASKLPVPAPVPGSAAQPRSFASAPSLSASVHRPAVRGGVDRLTQRMAATPAHPASIPTAAAGSATPLAPAKVVPQPPQPTAATAASSAAGASKPAAAPSSSSLFSKLSIFVTGTPQRQPQPSPQPLPSARRASNLPQRPLPIGKPSAIPAPI